MALPAALQALYDRLQGYNGDPYNATTNPLGIARGGNQNPIGNFLKLVKDYTAFGKGISDLTSSASADAQATAADRAQTGQDRTASAASASSAAQSETRAQGWADAPENTEVIAGKYSARHWAAKAAAWAAGVSLPAITTANALQFLQVKPDGSGYRTVEIPPDPAILPITMTAPASGATDVGAGGTYTFVARAFVGDTTGFYSNYGVPVASRFVNVYEPGGTNPVKTFTAAGGGPSLVATFAAPLVVSHAYQFEFGYTDAQGNTVKSPKVSATTASQFKPSEGQAYQGGFLAFQNFGDGDLFDLVVAPKSTEASRVYFNGTNSFNTLSRVSGFFNTEAINQVIGSGTTTAGTYARNGVSIGGVAGYLGAIDELRAISSKLRPSVAVEAAFKTGGAEVFTLGGNGHWSSTETSASNALPINMATGEPTEASKTNSNPVRAIKRVSTIAPYPIGTAMEGGYLAAYFTDLSSGSPVTYMLIVADKATEVTRAWSSSNASIGGTVQSRTNGSTPTETFNWTSVSPAFLYCKDLVSGGKTDWYLGAVDEMLAIARMNSQLPSGQQIRNDSSPYWTSTEADSSTAKRFFLDSSGATSEAAPAKSTSYLVRPIRRVLLPAT